MQLPNFLLIGASRSGTTSLYKYLGEHPDIYMSPVKEPHYFAIDPDELEIWKSYYGPNKVADLESYAALFSGARGERIVGEASPSYMWSTKARDRIREQLPQVKMAAILRDPVARAYSHFMLRRRKGHEPISRFERVVELELEDDRSRPLPARYLQMGFYARHLEGWAEEREAGRLRVWLYDDLVADAAGVLKDMYGFLDVDKSYEPDLSTVHHKGSVVKSERLRGALRESGLRRVVRAVIPVRSARAALGKALRNVNTIPSPHIDPELRTRLIKLFEPDILKLQDLLDRDLSHWLAPAPSRPQPR